MRTRTSGTLTATFYDSKVWKQERNLISVTDTASLRVFLCYPSTSDVIAAYTLNSDKKVVIDMSDFIRLHGTTANVSVKNESGSSVIVGYTVAGLINPRNLLIPPTANPTWLRICPPSKIIAPISGYYNQNLCEVVAIGTDVMCEFTIPGGKVFGFHDDNTPSVIALNGSSTMKVQLLRQYNRSAITAGGIEYVYVSNYTPQEGDLACMWQINGSIVYTANRDKAMTAYPNSDGTGTAVQITDAVYSHSELLQTIKLEPMECDRQYASVKWVSPTGITRQATMEVCKHKIAPAGDIALLTDDNSYSLIRGRVDSFSLRLRSVTDYDIWYYGSIATSSKVEVSLNGGSTWQPVEVTNKSVTIPDGSAGKLGDLELTLNWKRYDAVVM